MILFVTFLCFLASSCYARPNYDELQPQNVVTVPTNCPEGQQWVNGACREIWSATIQPANIVTVPTNCPPGQSFINGQCRDVWIRAPSEVSNRRMQNYNLGYQRDMNDRGIIKVPELTCPYGYKRDKLGNCRKIMKS